MRSSNLSNSSEDREVQNLAILRAISRRAAAIASAFLRSSIEVDRPDVKTARALQKLSRRERLSRFWMKTRATSVFFCARELGVSTESFRSVQLVFRSTGPVFFRSLVRIALESRVSLRPAMRLVAGRTLDRIHLLDWRRFKRLGIHRVSGVDHLPRRRTLDQYAVHYSSTTLSRVSSHARRVPRSADDMKSHSGQGVRSLRESVQLRTTLLPATGSSVVSSWSG